MNVIDEHDESVAMVHGHRALYPAGEALVLMSERQARQLVETVARARKAAVAARISNVQRVAGTAVLVLLAFGLGMLIG